MRRVMQIARVEKGYIKEERDRIVAFVDSSPEAARALLRIDAENVVLKSSKQNLLNSKADVDKIHYPFLLTKVAESRLFYYVTKAVVSFMIRI